MSSKRDTDEFTSQALKQVLDWGHTGAEVTQHAGAAFRRLYPPFRRTDLVNVSMGLVWLSVPWAFTRAVKATFPDVGFHWCFVALAASQLIRIPTRPLQMLRW
jgi:hypothetical protein